MHPQGSGPTQLVPNPQGRRNPHGPGGLASLRGPTWSSIQRLSLSLSTVLNSTPLCVLCRNPSAALPDQACHGPGP